MLKRFISYYKPHKRLLVLDLGMALVRSGAMILIPLFVRRVLRTDLPNGDMRSIGLNLAALFGLTIIMSLAAFINTKWGHFLGTRLETDMRGDLFRHLQKLSFTYFDNTKTGHIMSRISNDLFTISEVAHHAPEDLFISFCTIVGAFSVMLSFNPTMALIAMAPLPIMVIWGAIFRRRMKRGFRRVRRRIADINSNVENAIQGIREVKSYANESHQIDKFDGVNMEFRCAKEGMYSVMAAFNSGMMFFAQSYKVLIIAAGVWMIHKERIVLGDLVAFLLYVGFIVDPIRRLVAFIEQYQQGAASFERFTEIMDTQPEIEDRPRASDLPSVKGDLAIENLSFRYPGTDEWVLRDITLRVRPGQTMAIVGESGAGKSTLASLIPRFYEPQQGRILLDGHDIMELRQRCLRRHIGIVQQNVFLFDSTVRDNILFGKPDATEAELMNAARDANILDFIQSLPDGFDTLVGEHGVKLSGGQKQRVSIARVFLKNPAILILDEATSSLDNESEEWIQQAIDRLSRDRTTLIVAHRLSTVRNADHTLVMRHGRIVEQGPHADLLAAKGYYHQLYSHSRL